METLVWLGTWEDPLGLSVGRLGKGCVKSTPLWGDDSHIEPWWTLNTNANPVDIQGQSSFCQTRIRSQSEKWFKWKWNQIIFFRAFLVSSPGTFAKHCPGVYGLEKAGLQECNRIIKCSSVTFVQNTKNTLKKYDLKKLKRKILKPQLHKKNVINWIQAF